MWLFIGVYGCSCSKKYSNEKEAINDFIARYDTVAFDELKGIFIAQRDRIFTGTIYMVESKKRKNEPLYFVTYNWIKQSVTEIKKPDREENKLTDTLATNDIIKAVDIIRYYDFYLVAVDDSQNVYINPFRPDEPAFFLRLKHATGDSIVRKGYVYELYRNNWYLNISRQKW